MLDFQLARCASPIIDLSFLIYACTLKSFRDQYFDEMLKMYHSELSNAIKLLGSDPEKLYSWDLFMKEVETFRFMIFFFGRDSTKILMLITGEGAICVWCVLFA